MKKYLIFFNVLLFFFIGCSNNTNGVKKVEKPSKKSEIKVNNEVKAVDKKIETTKDISKENAKVIVIDPGHANRANLEKEPIAPDSSQMKIKDGGGCQGINSKIPEYVVNMEVALKLKVLLEEKDFRVIMTKTEHSQSLGNVERAEIGNKANADLVIRIHADSCENSSAHGASMLVHSGNNERIIKIDKESRRCAEIVLNDLVKEAGMKNRGIVERKDITGFNWSKVPVILVEMGFMSNPEEDKLLTSDEYQNKIAKGLADGITSALR